VGSGGKNGAVVRLTERVERLPRAVVVRGTASTDPAVLLDRALTDVGVLQPGGVGVARSTGARALVLAALSPPVPVLGSLVGALVDALVDRGWLWVDVGGVVTALDRDRGFGSVATLARSAGLTGQTGRGRSYQVVDLLADVVEASVPAQSVLSGGAVSRAWTEADLRVVVARSASDLLDGYPGCVAQQAYAAVADSGADPADVGADVHAYLGADLAVIDGVTSSHGPAGSWVLRPLETGTVVAATSSLLADVALAALHGTDPAVSRPVAAALRLPGGPRSPLAADIRGDLSPFPGWQGPHPWLRDAARRLATSPGALRSLAAVVAESSAADPDTATDPILPALRALVAPTVTGGGPATAAWLSGVLLAGSAAAQAAGAWSVMFVKDRVRRVEVPLAMDAGQWTEADYRAVDQHIRPLERLLADVPLSAGGVRWRYHEESVLFEIARDVAAPFGQWCARVDIAAGISLMADYLGGRRVPVAVDDQGRPTMQAERNVYLPQPNYLAAWGGAPIDVCKLELVEYGDRTHRLAWRTVSSANGSASRDDGSMTFEDAGPDRTRVTVRGWQRFILPPLLAGADLDRFPEIKNGLVDDAYRRFFSATFDNLEACYEGRPFRIGRQVDPGSGPEPPWTATAAMLVDAARSWLAEGPAAGAERGHAEPVVDDAGFRHFPGPQTGGASAAAAERRAWPGWPR